MFYRPLLLSELPFRAPWPPYKWDNSKVGAGHVIDIENMGVEGK